MKCWIYKGQHRQETYLFLPSEDGTQEVPALLLDQLGPLELVMELTLSPQQRLARAMHQGIKAYFYANPPQGTRIAQLSREKRMAREHVIRRGDTLSGIAQRYNVSVSRIRSANSLRSNKIKVGQVLTIPPAIET